MEEGLGALARIDRQVGARGIADEHRVPGQGEPLVDHEGAVLGTVAGRVQHTDARRADLEHLAVGERLVWELRLGEAVHRDGNAMLEREPAMTGDVVGVCVGLEHPLDPHPGRVCGGEVLLDRERGVDHDRDSGLVVADEIRGTAEPVVHELLEERHGP